MHFYEVLKSRKIDPIEEFNRVESLLNEETIPYGFRVLISLKKWLDKTTFRDLKSRDSFTSIDDMLKGLEIYDSKLKFNFDDECCGNNDKCFERLYLYCEILLNIFSESLRKLADNENANKVAQHIKENIVKILEKTNCKWESTKNGIIIIENDFVATEAIEFIKDDISLACEIMEYNRKLNKGNIKRKKQILIQLAAYTEPWNNEFKNTPYDQLYNDSRFLANEIDIRHNNKETSRYIFTDGWTNVDYENWYDKAYHTLLMVIIARNQKGISVDVDALKQNKKENPNRT